jgi:hypothetical protein
MQLSSTLDDRALLTSRLRRGRSAAFDGGPGGNVDGIPEKVVDLCEAVDVAKAENGADYATVGVVSGVLSLELAE